MTTPNARFQEALKEHNFGKRCHLLSRLGRDLKSSEGDQLSKTLDALEGPTKCAFADHARLLVAKAAVCVGYGQKYLDHPSQTVRFEVVRSKCLLTPQDAKTAFLSGDSSRKLKKFLTKCPVLPADEEVLEHGWSLFGEKDKEIFWDLMMKIDNAESFDKWLHDNDQAMKEHMSSVAKLDGLPQITAKFPHLMAKLVLDDTVVWNWYFAKDALNSHPGMALRTIILDRAEGNGPKRGYVPGVAKQDFLSTAESWGWRRQPEIMFEIVKEGCQKYATSSDDVMRNFLRELASSLMETKSTRHYLTINQKISYLLQMWECVPDFVKEKHPSMATYLPRGSDKRPNELERIIQAMWKIVGALTSTTRRTLLVGQVPKGGGRPTGPVSEFMKTFGQMIPAPHAINNFFFKILEEYEASTAAYKFMQSNICKSDDGAHDTLMLAVFEKYLKVEEVPAPELVDMFETLLTDAKTQDVIQDAFKRLMYKLDDHVSLDLLRRIVKRMGTLQIASEKKDSEIPKATRPVPDDWVRFIELPEKVSPHIDFLFNVLNSGTEPSSLLGAMLEKYGRSYFWDAMDTVLAALVSKKTETKLLESVPKGNNSVLFAKVDVVSFTKVAPEKKLQKSSSKDLTGSEEAWQEYFNGISEAKKKINAKDPGCRIEGYQSTIRLASQCKDKTKPFEELLPFLTNRFNAEQEQCRTVILERLFAPDGMPVDLWEPNLAHLSSLWKMASKARDNASYMATFSSMGKRILEYSLKRWEAGKEPTEFCLFGREVSQGNTNIVNIVVSAAQESANNNVNRLRDDPEALKTVAKWIFETTVTTGDEVGLPISKFWDTCKSFGKLRTNRLIERGLWVEWPFLKEMWAKLLTEASKQKAAEFIFISIVDKLAEGGEAYMKCLKPGPNRSTSKASDWEEPLPPWTEPIETPEYKAAVRGIMEQIESGEIPAKEGSSMLARRIQSLCRLTAQNKLSIQKRGPQRQGWAHINNHRGLRYEHRDGLDIFSSRGSYRECMVVNWFNSKSWDFQRQSSNSALPWRSMHFIDDFSHDEIACLSKLLDTKQSLRAVLWNIAEAACWVTGPVMSDLLEKAIWKMDPQFEGRARCVSRHYPYVNIALTQDGPDMEKKTPDVLTPLVELWLLDDKARDARAAKLMSRSDCELFLFFGRNFARHLSNGRQEWLQQCLLKLKRQTEDFVEFYHWSRRGPELMSLGLLKPGVEGWRRNLKPEMKSPENLKPQMYLWHPDTQNQFLDKAIQSTETIPLALVNRAVFGDSFKKVSEILDQYPKEQSKKERNNDLFGFEVIQAAGAYSDIVSEIDRRFKEMPDPVIFDAVDDSQIEVLLFGLGKADDATASLKVLGSYASKVKQAKEAVTKMIAQVSPPQARELIRDVMLPRKAGVGLQIQGVKKISELHIPNAFELYSKAWNDGKCQRDVAGNVLGQVALGNELEPEQVRSFFGYFDMNHTDDRKAYVADFLLDQLTQSTEWSLPFLPSVIAKLAALPGITNKAVQALRSNRSHPTEVLQALTDVLQTAKLASRTKSIFSAGQRTQMLQDLNNLTSSNTQRSLLNDVERMNLSEADTDVLGKFIDEHLALWEEGEMSRAVSARGDTGASTLLHSILSCWIHLLRIGKRSEWQGILDKMYKRLVNVESPYVLTELATALCSRLRNMGVSESEEYVALLHILGNFFASFFKSGLLTISMPKAQGGQTEPEFFQAEKDKLKHGHKLVLESWSNLLAGGCPEVETNLLFKHAPDGKEIELVKGLVKMALETLQPGKGDNAGGPRSQKRPTSGWAHSQGYPVDQCKVGAKVEGVVTNSTKQFGVFVDFGCIRDGKLKVPESDFKKYRVGDVVPNCVVNKVEVSGKSGTAFIELLLSSSAGELQVDAGGSARAVARRAVQWLASSNRDERWNTLIDLLASIMTLEKDGSFFEDDLTLLGSPMLETSKYVPLVSKLMNDSNCCKELQREALRWLSERNTQEAIRLWPLLLKKRVAGEEVEKSDVVTMLDLCRANSLRLPTFEDSIAKTLPNEIIAMLAASDLVEARLLSLQAMQQQSYPRGQPPSSLGDLKGDSSQVVRTGARVLWKALGGPEDEPADEEEEEEEA